MNVAAGILSVIGAVGGGFAARAVAKNVKQPQKDTVLFSTLVGGAVGALVLGSFAPPVDANHPGWLSFR